MPDPDKTPFLSLRNVPLWMGLAIAGVVAAMVIWPT